MSPGGTMRWFKDDTGYGRITADDGEILFVRLSGIVGDEYHSLAEATASRSCEEAGPSILGARRERRPPSAAVGCITLGDVRASPSGRRRSGLVRWRADREQPWRFGVERVSVAARDRSAVASLLLRLVCRSGMTATGGARLRCEN
jgi:cold shock CspA family protein